MHILIIGAAGMVGRKLVERLMRDSRLGQDAITRMTLHDVVEPAAPPGVSVPVETHASDFSEPGEAEKLVAVRPDVIFHLADLSWGKTHPGTYVRGNVYYNAANSLQTWPIALIYIVANIALSLHIYHGAWSMFQSLGINNPKYNQLRRMFATGLAVVILVGNLSFPIMALSGVIDKDNVAPDAVVEVQR